MATMYEKMMERLVDRIEHQAVELANAKQEAENLKKELAWMKEQKQQECSCEHDGIWQQMDDLAESNKHLLKDNTQMRALLVGWWVVGQNHNWPVGTWELAEATREFVNPETEESVARAS